MIIKTEYEDLIQRNIGVLDWEEQNKIKNKSISIIGLDDQGISSVLVAKIGYKELNLIGSSKVELNNLNSGFLATVDMVGQNYTDAATTIIQKHNPLVKCSSFQIGDTITLEDSKEKINGSDFCIITTRNPFARIAFSRAAEELDIPYVISMDIGLKVLMFSFKKGIASFESFTRQPSMGRKLTCDLYESIYSYNLELLMAIGGFCEKSVKKEEIIVKSIPMASNFIANLSVAEVVKMSIGKGKIHYGNDAYTMDLLTWKPWNLSLVLHGLVKI
ncbi:MAG TPA: ThiF family adenylyltransferase [Clostridia bacterium]